MKTVDGICENIASLGSYNMLKDLNFIAVSNFPCISMIGKRVNETEYLEIIIFELMKRKITRTFFLVVTRSFNLPFCSLFIVLLEYS